MFKKLYLWVESLAKKPNAEKWLYSLSFAESSFFPIPPDVLLIPIALQNIKQSFKLAFWTTFFSTFGGMFGYVLGYFAINLAQSMIKVLGYQPVFETIQTYFETWGVIFVLVAGVSPIPYKIIAIASGITGFNFIFFVLASIVGRGARFFLLATLIYFYGESINLVIKKYVEPVTYFFIVVIIFYFIYNVFYA